MNTWVILTWLESPTTMNMIQQVRRHTITMANRQPFQDNKMKRLLPILFPLTSCIAMNVSISPDVNDTGFVEDVDTQDPYDTNDTHDTDDIDDEHEELFLLDMSSHDQYGLALMRGWHVLLDGIHGIVREFPHLESAEDVPPPEEEFTNMLDWNESWGFSVSLGSVNEEVHGYFVSGMEMPLFQTDGRLLTLRFGTHTTPKSNCDSGLAVYPELTFYHVEGDEICQEILIEFIENGRSFCKDLTDEEFALIGSEQHSYSDYLESGFVVTVHKVEDALTLWLNQTEVANGAFFPIEDSGCNLDLEDHSRELSFGRGMRLPDGRVVYNLISRVDNIVLFTPEVGSADLPGPFNIWYRPEESPYELFRHVDLVSDSVLNFQDGFGWWPFENPSNSPHTIDAAMSGEPINAVDFSSLRGGTNNGPNNMMRIVNLVDDDEFVNIDELYVNEDNKYGFEADW